MAVALNFGATPAEAWSNVLAVAGLAITFASGVVSQICTTSKEDSGRKVLTPAGQLALLISAISLAGSIGGFALHISIDNKAKTDAEEARTADEQRQKDEAAWMRESGVLSKKIYDQTSNELQKSDAALKVTLDKFAAEQAQIARTNLQVQLERVRALSPIGSPAIELAAKLNCGAPAMAGYCNANRVRSRPGEFGKIWAPTSAPDVEFVLCIIRSDRTAAEYAAGKDDVCDLAFRVFHSRNHERSGRESDSNSTVAIDDDKDHVYIRVDQGPTHPLGDTTGNITSMFDLADARIFVYGLGGMNAWSILGLKLTNATGETAYMSGRTCSPITIPDGRPGADRVPTQEVSTFVCRVPMDSGASQVAMGRKRR